MPRVSVNIPAYNHGKYVAEAIQSVLDQSFTDFEIVITDDGSTDNTVEVIKSFNDPRIRLFEFEKNRGAAFASRNNVYNSRGEYMAMLSSDDIFLPGKLERQVKFLDEHPDVWAVFGYAQVIDEDGADFDDKDQIYSRVFNQPNRTRHEWLRYFFYNSNCLWHPSVLARREVYTDLGLPDPRYAQVGDFYRWIKTCLKHEIYVMPEKLFKFRARAGALNASGNRPEARRRTYYEFYQIFRHYLEIDSTEDLLKIFPEAEKYGTVEKDLIPYFVARLAIDNDEFVTLFKILGINVIFDLLGDEDMIKKLEKQCGFTHRDFVELTGRYDLFNIDAALANVQLQDIRSSMSWIITSPLRRVLGVFRK